MTDIIELNEERKRLLQLNILELIVEVDRICRKNDIKYSLDGGTLLGAIRHKGFVPWDDDGDVIFTREEYEKFYEACKTDLDKDHFFLQDYRTDPGYRWGYAKMRLLGTDVVRKGHENLTFKSGVCIDVFVNDNVPDNPISRRLYYGLNFCLRKILYSEMGRTQANNAVLRAWYRVLFWIPKQTCFNIRNRYSAKINRNDTVLVSHLLFPYPRKTCKFGMPSECFKEHIETEFEGMKFSVFKEYDKYLKILYGDYMKLPPEEKRKGQLNPVKLELHEVTYDEIKNRYKQQFE